MAPRKGMRSTKILMELEALAEKLGIQVIYEKLSQSRSGLCRLYDQHMLFVERNLDEDEKVQVFVSALSRFPLEDIAMLPGIRNLVMEYHSRNDTHTESNEASLRYNQNLLERLPGQEEANEIPTR
jgi:hypothetical protein